MLDIKLVRENPEIVQNNLQKRGDPEKLEMLNNLINYDKKWRNLLVQANELRHKRKKITTEVANLKKQKKDASKQIEKAKHIPQQIKKLEIQVAKYRENAEILLMKLPNLLHESVPFGKDESDNVVEKLIGRPPKFGFKPKSHVEIASDLGLIDFERAAKVSGHGFYYLKGDLARLDFAIMTYTIDFLRNRDYTLVEPPLMMHRKPYLGVTDLEFFGDQLYKIENDDLYLIATSEHPMAAINMDEVILQKDLPIKYVGISPCFRKEVGTHGKYTKGLFRVHQFNKIEQFIFCLPEDSWKFHEELQKNSEDLYNSLGLHYRVVNVCTGDIGIIAAKKYDIEVWMADDSYREAGSNSNCTDYQARRLNIKYREKEGQSPVGFVHTLNNTAIATSRTLIAILEQNQQKDGTVLIPDVLRQLMGDKERLE
ncbi:seryl-tRNA synthetase [miscellaneous Crenarchaeota group-1 archaeon SG8-32-1]|uniref:Serine--tRNA ligase n=1 Tax=miscellaneous Crenarchaeota group-1 archaeon SG8-32-1 TaxID=1685124 RepID=A0A0M0BUH3_9ARCH|nr:MAG: seryl-tRNA synthetase [miscellaneous Crenarchaeota group-1 archaeon SG8-32-1]